MLAEIADQRGQIDRLMTRVKNGNWELGKVKKEAETLRSIMKGYVATIDSLNQLNLALIDENDQMRARVEAIQERNANLVERQNMEEMIVAGQTLQAAEALLRASGSFPMVGSGKRHALPPAWSKSASPCWKTESRKRAPRPCICKS